MAGEWEKTESKQDGDFALATSENDACRQRNQRTKKGQFGGGQWEGFRGMGDRGFQIKPYTRHFWQGVFGNIFSFFERIRHPRNPSLPNGLGSATEMTKTTCRRSRAMALESE